MVVQAVHFVGGVDWVEADASDPIGRLVRQALSYSDHLAKYFDSLVDVQMTDAALVRQVVSVVMTAVSEVLVHAVEEQELAVIVEQLVPVSIL